MNTSDEGLVILLVGPRQKLRPSLVNRRPGVSISLSDFSQKSTIPMAWLCVDFTEPSPYGFSVRRKVP